MHTAFVADRLRAHAVVLVDESLVLRPLTEDDWAPKWMAFRVGPDGAGSSLAAQPRRDRGSKAPLRMHPMKCSAGGVSCSGDACSRRRLPSSPAAACCERRLCPVDGERSVRAA